MRSLRRLGQRLVGKVTERQHRCTDNFHSQISTGIEAGASALVKHQIGIAREGEGAQCRRCAGCISRSSLIYQAGQGIAGTGCQRVQYGWRGAAAANAQHDSVYTMHKVGDADLIDAGRVVAHQAARHPEDINASAPRHLYRTSRINDHTRRLTVVDRQGVVAITAQQGITATIADQVVVALPAFQQVVAAVAV